MNDKAKPSQAKPSQAKPSQAKPSQAKPSQAKPKHNLVRKALAFSLSIVIAAALLNFYITTTGDRFYSESDAFLSNVAKQIQNGAIDYQNYYASLADDNDSSANTNILEGISTEFYDFSEFQTSKINVTDLSLYFPTTQQPLTNTVITLTTHPNNFLLNKLPMFKEGFTLQTTVSPFLQKY